MRSYLVVGNQTLDSPELAKAIDERIAKGAATFHLVAPSSTSSPGTRKKRVPWRKSA
jgi:hypothetical protein